MSIWWVAAAFVGNLLAVLTGIRWLMLAASLVSLAVIVAYIVSMAP